MAHGLHDHRVASCDFFVAQIRIEVIVNTRPQPAQVNVYQETVTVGFSAWEGNRKQITKGGAIKPRLNSRDWLERQTQFEVRRYFFVDDIRVRFRTRYQFI